MKWLNLKNNKCPQCNGDFTKGLDLDPATEIMAHRCGFKITQERFREIVMDMNSKSIPKDYENQPQQNYLD